MATRAKFGRLPSYSREFGEASHIFLENCLWRMSASLASPRNTAWRMSASLASPRNTAWRVLASLASTRKTARQMSASLASHNINTRHIRKICTRKIRCRVAIAYVKHSWSLRNFNQVRRPKSASRFFPDRHPTSDVPSNRQPRFGSSERRPRSGRN